jgi:predicted transcriptional regulator
MADRTSPHLSVFRPRNDGLQKLLGALEAQVMDAVWLADSPVCVDDVRQTLSRDGKESAYTTIMTTLSRLHKKGLLDRALKGKAYMYTARVSRRELTSSATQDVIDGLMSTFAEPAMSYFVEALGKSDPDKLEALANIIEQKRREQSS